MINEKNKLNISDFYGLALVGGISISVLVIFGVVVFKATTQIWLENKMPCFVAHRNILITEILQYSKINRTELRVFNTETLNLMLNDLRKKRQK